MVKLVVDQRSRGTPVGTAGNVAPGVVAAAIDQGDLVGASGYLKLSAYTCATEHFIEKRLGVMIDIQSLFYEMLSWVLLSM